MNKKKCINLLIPIIRTLRRIGLIPNSPLINDRAMEYGFMAKELNFKPGDKILDIGFLESVIPFILAGLGADIHALDLRKCPINYPGVKTYISDIRKTDFDDKFFDKIIAISTIEHLGIPTRYNSYGDSEADRKALLEMKRILTDDGIIIITVPFGKSAIDSVQKTYDKKDIEVQGKELPPLQDADSQAETSIEVTAMGGGGGYTECIEVRPANPVGADLYEGRIWILS